jgi:hypothetical protein
LSGAQGTWCGANGNQVIATHQRQRGALGARGPDRPLARNFWIGFLTIVQRVRRASHAPPVVRSW